MILFLFENYDNNYCKFVSEKVKLFIDIPNDIIASETVVYIL